MLIFVNEDRSYLSWLAHHRHGFVLDMLRKPTLKQPVAHRANCVEIKLSKSRKTHWTTGRHIKACGLEIQQLQEWCRAEYERDPLFCAQCRPTDKTPSSPLTRDRRMTRLGKEIMECVTDSAVISFEQDSQYDVTVESLAGYLGKSPAHITIALLRLIEDGFVRIEGKDDLQKKSSRRRQIFPTVDALRTLPFFHEMSIRKVEAEIERLTSDDD